ncbi:MULTISPECIES: acyltransferase family protein [Leptolyngbya]|uniref:acyltransferase family protein n=1 Tax=Leptolyngbya TaxID=47251 RepID=UPI0016898239|nr:acyltransferase [Leptolyngbya sp. FACHB-1624]MBD1854875.1 acyltransferase [Leptolyngbya sp. FACHB-1624]
MASSKKLQRLAWLEGIRIFAAVLLLLYHAQLLFTKYAFTPQPTGLAANLQQIFLATRQMGDSWLTQVLSLLVWFGYQFVDVFVLVSGFSLVLSLKGQPIEVGSFLKRRILRILLPFWTVAWLAYPVLWTVGELTNSYIPDAWHTFAGMSFPILFDYGGELLLPTNGPWWFVPLIMSFALIFPVLWYLMNRWGSRNLLLTTTVITLVYRALAVYVFKGHPTYAIVSASAGWQPFVHFIAKLSTFVLGMVVARQYSQGKGAIFWKSSRAFSIGIAVYAIGFVAQFYRFGWIFDDFLLAIGLTLCCMVVFRFFSDRLKLGAIMIWLGIHSYSYFLIHNFVVDRTLNLYVHQQLPLYYQVLPWMVLGTLALSVIADHVTPWVVKGAVWLWHYTDARLTPIAKIGWTPRVGESVQYKGKSGWTIQKVERVVHDKAFYLCRISDGRKTVWVNQNDLKQAAAAQQANV